MPLNWEPFYLQQTVKALNKSSMLSKHSAPLGLDNLKGNLIATKYS